MEDELLLRFLGDKKVKSNQRVRFAYTALDGCGVKYWAGRSDTDTSCYNALVQGGRCLNENPYEYSMDHGLDIDISGCYGDSLRSLVYPIGLPTVWRFTPNQQRMLLGKWLEENETKLLPGLWQCVVSGELPFEQDLVYSKLATINDIRKAATSPSREATDIPSPFVMLRREIKNGVITADVLERLRGIASSREWAGIKQLEVVTAVAYLKDDKSDSLEDWCDKVLADRGEHRYTKEGEQDNRTRAWYGIPLEDFIGRLVDERKKYKAMGKDDTLPLDERARAKGMDTMLKLFVNTKYGVLASRFFAIGNTVLANNITARARCGVWMVAKALGCRQSITDGGIYTPLAVCTFNPTCKLPGLETFSRLWEWKDRKNYTRGYCSMGRVDWLATWANLPNIDRLAMDHVRDFWLPYGLALPFKLEHKKEHTFTAAAYWSKADYALRTREKVVYKLRGKDRHKGRHPTYDMMDSILAGKDEFPSDLSYKRGGIMKIGKYRIVQSSNGYETIRHLRPGDTLPDEVHQARYNNTHMPIRDEKEFLRRSGRRKVHHGKPMEWFERYAARGISGIHDGMASDKLR